MSKKIELTAEQTQECLRMYNDELLGSTTISERMKIHKTIIIRTLKENGIVLGPSGRRNIGGKSVADKKYATKNKEKLNEYHKKWSKENKEELKKYHTEWRNKNREHVSKKGREWIQNKRKTDNFFRFKDRIRTAVWQLLKERNINKTNKTFALLGYTIEELMNHLEKKFTEGMTWENYGEWHVDHIIPMCSFKFETTDDPEFKECWKLENLQPLWGPENLSKGPRYL
jgi:hypothetical protein